MAFERLKNLPVSDPGMRAALLTALALAEIEYRRHRGILARSLSEQQRQAESGRVHAHLVEFERVHGRPPSVRWAMKTIATREGLPPWRVRRYIEEKKRAGRVNHTLGPDSIAR